MKKTDSAPAPKKKAPAKAAAKAPAAATPDAGDEVLLETPASSSCATAQRS